jgi:hypothetical protein
MGPVMASLSIPAQRDPSLYGRQMEAQRYLTGWCSGSGAARVGSFSTGQ